MTTRTIAWCAAALVGFAGVARALGQQAGAVEPTALGPARQAAAAAVPATQAAPPPAWARQDPADSLYRAAREALNRNDYRRAVELFARIVERYPGSEYAPDAHYWQAFARYRLGGDEDLRLAHELLERQRARYPDAATRGDAEVLVRRINGELARRGNEEAVRDVTRDAEQVTKAACPERDDHDLRVAALNALLQMDAERAVPVLRQVLDRQDACSADLRRRAVFLLSQKRTDETEEVLLGVARNDPDEEVRKQAVFWLSQVPSERAVAALEDILLNSTDSGLRDRAIFALSQQRADRAGAVLRSFLEQEDAPRELREKAIFWIGQQSSVENAEYLRRLFDRLDPELKDKVLFSLSQMRGHGNERWLLDVAGNANESVAVRKKALFWAGQGATAIGDLVALYGRLPDREMKKQLIFVLSQRREPEAVDKLMDIVRTDADANLRKDALFWLSQSKDPRVVEFLQEIINRP